MKTSDIEERRKKYNCGGYCYSHKDGNTIMWKSTKECAEALGLNRPNITAVLKGRVSQHKGYTFTYVGGDH